MTTLAAGVNECNRSGHGLVESAAHGVNTSKLEKDLEKMNGLWNQLKENVSTIVLIFYSKYS